MKRFQQTVQCIEPRIFIQGDDGIFLFPESAEDLLEADEEVEDRLIGEIEIFEDLLFHIPIVLPLFRSHFEMQRFVNTFGKVAAFHSGFLIDIGFDFSGKIFHVVSEDRDR